MTEVKFRESCVEPGASEPKHRKQAKGTKSAQVVSWDLFPRNAIVEVTLMPGSNPLCRIAELTTERGGLAMRLSLVGAAPIEG